MQHRFAHTGSERSHDPHRLTQHFLSRLPSLNNSRLDVFEGWSHLLRAEKGPSQLLWIVLESLRGYSAWGPRCLEITQMFQSQAWLPALDRISSVQEFFLPDPTPPH